MSRSRVKNTMRNSLVGTISFVVSAVMSFVVRTVFIYTLGVEYLGINGLYSNILAVLAVSDLGLYTVMVYSLYKPLAENNQERIAVLVKYYHKLYLIIALIVTVLGLSCVPFLRFLVKDTTLSQGELILYYLLILANSVCSYFAISKSTLIRADQNMNIIQGVNAITKTALHLSQILVLLLFKDFVLYLALYIVFTLVNNVILTIIASKKYPYLKNTDKNVAIDAQTRNELKVNLKSTFLYKLGATIITSTDNILISVILGTAIVGYYNNYYTVIALVNGVIGIISSGVLASIGNFNATQNKQRKFELFTTITMMFYIIGGFCAACYLAIFDDFMVLWLGKDFVLDELFLIALVIKCTVTCVSNPLWMVRESSGVFSAVRYVMFCSAILNIILSIVFAQFIGLAGIILGTAVSDLLTLFWYEPKVLCKSVFEVSVWKYWKKVIRLCIALLPCLLVGWICHELFTTNILFMAGKIILCGIITAVSFVLIFGKTDEMRWIYGIISKFLNKNKLQEDKQ